MYPHEFIIAHNKFFLDQLYNLQINIAINGNFVDNETLKVVRPNHLKILLKHEYKNKYNNPDKLSGKELEKFIKNFIETAVISVNYLRNCPSEAHRFKKYNVNGFI